MSLNSLYTTARAPLYFFPRSQRFWLYYGCALVFWGSVNIGIHILGSDSFPFHNLYFSLFTGGYITLASLASRYIFHHFNWLQLSLFKQHGLILAASCTLAFMVTAILSLTVLLLFKDFRFSDAFLAKNNWSLAEGIQFFVINYTVLYSLFMVLWSYIYLSVCINSREKTKQITQLQLENQLKTEQLTSLQQQLNPAFLFSSLHHIREQIYQDVDLADEHLTDFSELLRYSLTASKHPTRPLFEELECIRTYLNLHNLSCQGLSTEKSLRVNFIHDISKNNEHIQVPPMCLQIQIEKMCHAFQPHSINIDLELSTNSDSLTFLLTFTLLFALTDEGENRQETHSRRDFSVHDVETDFLLDSLSDSFSDLRQRLALLYGMQAKFNLVQKFNKATPKVRYQTELKLPLKTSALNVTEPSKKQIKQVNGYV